VHLIGLSGELSASDWFMVVAVEDKLELLLLEQGS
jgi:hypothetical protein